MKIGDFALNERIITENDIISYSKLSNDYNPIHIDEEYAAKTNFKHRIAHGLLVASDISSILSNKLPGPGTIYLSQNLSFKNPVFINDKILTIVTVVEIIKINVFKMKTVCSKKNGIIVIDGTAIVINKNITI